MLPKRLKLPRSAQSTPTRRQSNPLVLNPMHTWHCNFCRRFGNKTMWAIWLSKERGASLILALVMASSPTVFLAFKSSGKAGKTLANNLYGSDSIVDYSRGCDGVPGIPRKQIWVYLDTFIDFYNVSVMFCSVLESVCFRGMARSHQPNSLSYYPPPLEILPPPLVPGDSGTRGGNICFFRWRRRKFGDFSGFRLKFLVSGISKSVRFPQ